MRGVKTIIASQEVSKAGLSPAKNQPLLLFNFFEFIVFLRDSKQNKDSEIETGGNILTVLGLKSASRFKQ
jgi:hypothetical protein